MIDHEKLQMKILEAIMSEMDDMEGEKMTPLGVKIEIEEPMEDEGMLRKKLKRKPKEEEEE